VERGGGRAEREADAARVQSGERGRRPRHNERGRYKQREWNRRKQGKRRGSEQNRKRERNKREAGSVEQAQETRGCQRHKRATEDERSEGVAKREIAGGWKEERLRQGGGERGGPATNVPR
jgi:hypothetical protein